MGPHEPLQYTDVQFSATQASGGAAQSGRARKVRIDPELLARLAAQITVAEGPAEKITVRAPYTGDVLATIPAGGLPEVELAVSRARAAQPAWAAVQFSERRRIFLKFHAMLLKRQAEVLDIIQAENGKARRHAFEEVLDTAVVARYYALRGEKILRPRVRKGALPGLTRTREFRMAVGVVGFVVPWNYPLNLAVTDAIPALMAGNTAVLMPDRQTSFTALWAVALLREAGLPADVLPVITGDGATIGPMLIDRVDYLTFTGSTRTGKIVGAQAAQRLIPCSLELGGKNPMLVLADADIEKAVDGAVRGSFASSGEACVSIERIYVHESIYREFLDRFAERTRKMRVGPAFDFSADMGSLMSDRQMSTVEEHVRDAVEKGATVVAGGKRRPDLGPLFYEPTILAGVLPGMKAYAEETFGPVVAVYPFATEAEAIARANDSIYGLSASVWTRDTARGIRLARKMHTGNVNVNEAYAATWASTDSPMGGMKESGTRPRHGAEGILKYTEAQSVAVQRLLPIAPPPGMDPARHARIMTLLLKFVRWIPGLR